MIIGFTKDYRPQETRIFSCNKALGGLFPSVAKALDSLSTADMLHLMVISQAAGIAGVVACAVQIRVNALVRKMEDKYSKPEKVVTAGRVAGSDLKN